MSIARKTIKNVDDFSRRYLHLVYYKIWMAKSQKTGVILACFGLLCSLFTLIYCLYGLSYEATSKKFHSIHENRLKNSMGWQKTESFLFVTIISAPGNFELRSAIRKTWLYAETDDTAHSFSIGTKSLNPILKESLEAEQEKYKDMIFLNELSDSYQNLTEKVIQSISIAYQQRKFRFFLKVDDDSYVNLQLFHQKLKALNIKKRLYWGFFDGRGRPKPKGHWKDTEWNLCDTYLPYALGGGYLISQDLVGYIAKNSLFLKRYPAEDVSVGAWLAPLNIRRIHDSSFDTEFKSRGCHNEYIVSHKQSIEDMQQKYENLKQHGKLCHHEIKKRLSYNYNWSVPPSKCCIRNDSSVP